MSLKYKCQLHDKAKDMHENKMLQTFCDPDLLQLAEVLEKFYR